MDQAKPEMVVQAFTGGPFGENCYVVFCAATREGILIDPGAAVPDALAFVANRTVDVREIVLTHAHIDHVDGVARAVASLGVPVSLHPDDRALYDAAPQQAQWFGLQMAPLPPIDRWLANGETLRFGECTLVARHTPGHAPGHVVFVGDGLCIVGDCVFQGSIGRTDLPGGDLAQLLHSIRGEILTLPDETVLYPGHGPETTVGHERVSNPFLVPSFGTRFA